MTDWVTVTMGYPASALSFDSGQGGRARRSWTAVVSFVSFGIVKLVVGLRVSEEEEREGLDITSHGERAYTG